MNAQDAEPGCAEPRCVTPGWYAGSTWVDAMGGVEEVWHVRGPAPFGGLRAEDREQAERVAAELNALHGRQAPTQATPSPAPDPTAQALAAQFGPNATVEGSTITITWGDDNDRE